MKHHESARDTDVDLAASPARVNPLHEPQDSHGQDAHANGAPTSTFNAVRDASLGRHGGRLGSLVRTAPVALPFRAELEQQFGANLGDISVHVGEREAVRALGGVAAAEGDTVAFAEASPDRATVAHEVTHVLQARTGSDGGHAAAEAEAEGVEARVAAGDRVGQITQGASGVHLKEENTPPQNLSAKEFLEELDNVSVVALDTLRFTHAAELHPFARYLASPAGMRDAMFMYGAPTGALLHPFHDKVGALIAPEPFEPLVDKARKSQMHWGQAIGPAHAIYMNAVGVELGNALTRRFQQSLTRMLPRFVQASKVERDAAGKLVATTKPQASSLTVSHPMDRAVAQGLCDPTTHVDVGKFAAEHPELCSAPQPDKKRAISLEFAWQKNLWHWVEAKPLDGEGAATAEEVARDLFGNEDQAYRLTAMPPLFGFRNEDVAMFVPARRTELDQLAKLHHPHPAVVNQAEIAAVTLSHRPEDGRPKGNEPGFAFEDRPLPGAEMFNLPKPAPEHGQPAPQAPAPVYAFPTGGDVDPTGELSAMEGADKLALKRAALTSDGKQHDEASVYERTNDALDLIDSAKGAFVSLQLSTERIDALGQSLRSTQRNAVATCFSDPNAQYALVDQQAKLLGRIVRGVGDTASHLVLYGGLGKDASSATPAVDTLPEFARTPIVEAGAAFSSAVDALKFPELAEPRVAHAERLAKTLRISITENTLHATLPEIQNAKDTEDDRLLLTAPYDPSDMAWDNDALLGELAVERIKMESDPAAAEKLYASTQDRVGDHTFEVSVVSNLEALDALWAAIESTEDFWKDGIDELIGNQLQAENRGFYATFRDKVFVPYRTGVTLKNQALKDTAKKEFKDLVESDKFKDHFKKVQQHLKDDASHKKWTKIVVGIAIAVVAMGLGQWYFGAYLAAGGGVFAASVGAAVIETGTGAVLNKLVFDADPTAGSLITGLVGAGAMYSILGKALVAGRAAGASIELAEAAERASLLQKTGKLAGDLTKEVLMVQAIGLVQGEIANMIDNHGKVLTEDQLREMFVHNLAGLVGMKIGQRLVDVTIDPMKPLRDLAKPAHIDIDGLAAEREALLEMAKQLDADKANADPAKAQLLLAREKAFLERVQRAREKLLELAAKHPEKVPAEQLAAIKDMKTQGADADLAQASAMMSLEEIGPNIYRADARAFDSILTMQKERGGELRGVHTDQNTGLRTLEIATADGGIVKIKEKLGDVGERPAPPVNATDAKRFEQWLENGMTHPDAKQLEIQRQRLREYYARDPQGAMATAERYGFAPESGGVKAPLAPEPTAALPEHPAAPDRAASDRAFDQYQFERETEGPKQSTIGDEPSMARGDFEEMYKAGYEYDPVARRWVLGEGRATPAGHVGPMPPQLARQGTSVIGSVHSEAVGHQVLRKLVNGEAEALRVIGIEPPAGLDTQANEWALGRRINDGQIVVIRGSKGDVNWAELPGIEDLSHTHPLKDPVTGQERLLSGPAGDGVIDLGALGGPSMSYTDMLYLLPSTGDVRFVALGGRQGHRVQTPYVHLGEGKIGNPTAGHNYDTVEIVIVGAEPHALLTKDSSIVIWKAKIELWAGDKRFTTMDLYQRHHSGPSFAADMPVLHPESGWAPLPADHPVRSAAAATTTPSSNITSVGSIDARTMKLLVDRGADPADPAFETFAHSLNAKDAAALSRLVDESVSGRVSGFDSWFARARKEDFRDRALADARLAHDELNANQFTTITAKPDGTLELSNPGDHAPKTLVAPEEILRSRGVPEAAIAALDLGATRPVPVTEATLINVARTYAKLESRGLVASQSAGDTHAVLSSLLSEPNGPRILEIIGTGRLDNVHGFARILSQLYVESNRTSIIVVLERAAALGDRFVFEPLKVGDRIPTNKESRAQRNARQAAEASGEAPRTGDRSDVDLGVPDGAGGWSEVYQMKLIEKSPRSVGTGHVLGTVAERVQEAAFGAKNQLKFADKPQVDAGRPPAKKIVEIRAEAPLADLDPKAWAPRFVAKHPDFVVKIYSTMEGGEWTVP